MASLNKLSDANFEAIRTRVVTLVVTGGVDAATAVEALLAKSADDGGGFTGVYARLLGAVVTGEGAPPCAEADASNASNASNASEEGTLPTEKETREACIARVRKAVGLFVRTEFGGENSGDRLWSEVRSAAVAMDADPALRYDAFCAGVLAKKRTLGRHATALAVLTHMARDLQEMHPPRPSEAAAVLVSVLRRAASDEDGDEDEREKDSLDVGKRRAAAVELALDLVSQLAVALGGGGRPTAVVKNERKASHSAALAELRVGIRSALPDPARFGDRCKFKAADVLALTMLTPPSASASASASAAHKRILPARANPPPTPLPPRPAPGAPPTPQGRRVGPPTLPVMSATLHKPVTRVTGEGGGWRNVTRG